MCLAKMVKAYKALADFFINKLARNITASKIFYLLMSTTIFWIPLLYFAPPLIIMISVSILLLYHLYYIIEVYESDEDDSPMADVAVRFLKVMVIATGVISLPILAIGILLIMRKDVISIISGIELIILYISGIAPLFMSQKDRETFARKQLNQFAKIFQ